jgi:phenylacetate-CoA ligase
MSLEKRLQEIVHHAYKHAPAVRQRFDAAGLKPADIRTLADLDKIPVLPKDEVVKMQRENPPFGGLLAVPLAEIKHIYFSPGPLYEPDPVRHDPTHVPMVQEALRQSGFVAGDVVLNTLSYHLVPAGLMLDEALTGLGCTVIPGGVGNSDLQVTMMKELGATGYVGTPSFLMKLIKKSEEMGLRWADFKLSKALVTAEPLPASLRRQLEEDYGVSVGNAYATAELGFLAINTTGGLPLTLLPAPIIQVVAPDTGQQVGSGEAGEVVITNFNTAYPLIRFGTGDMAIYSDPAPGKSQQQERSITLVGRSGEAVKIRGMFVHPNQLRYAVSQEVALERVQAIVTRPELRDQFEILIQLKEPAAENAVARIKAQVQQFCRVRVDSVSFVAPGVIAENAPIMLDKRTWD